VRASSLSISLTRTTTAITNDGTKMGCGDSTEVAVFYNKLPGMWRQDFSSIGLSQTDVWKMRDVFHHLDRDGSGKISYFELLMHIDIDPSVFSERMFRLFDLDHSGTIDFREYVLAIWNYCTLDQRTIGMFAFEIYDKDHSGNLSPNEVEKMIRDIYGKKADASMDVKQ
jgi:Ca2+-binding EF-hand superfamily protein